MIDEPIKLHCQVMADQDAEITWYRFLNVTQNDTFIELPFNGTNYVIKKVTRDWHQTGIACSATNSVGSSSVKGCLIDVQYGPIVKVQPEIHARLGDRVVVQCEVDANPPAVSVQWRRKSEVLFFSGTYIIDEISLVDEGEISCVAVNHPILGETQVITAHNTTLLIVDQAPVFKENGRRKMTAYIGQPLLLACDVTPHHNDVTFSWTFNNKQLDNGENVEIKSQPFHSSLYLSKVTGGDVGNYSCFAKGQGGVSEQRIAVLLPGKPDPLVSCSIHNSTSNAASFICVCGYDGGDVITFYAYTLSQLGQEVLQQSYSNYWADSDGLNYSSVRVIGLQPGTNHSIRIYTKNTHGFSRAPYIIPVLTGPDQSSDISSGLDSATIGSVIGGVFGGILIIALLTTVAVCTYIKCQRNFDNDEGWRPLVDDETLDEELEGSGDFAMSWDANRTTVAQVPDDNSDDDMLIRVENDNSNSPRLVNSSSSSRSNKQASRSGLKLQAPLSTEASGQIRPHHFSGDHHHNDDDSGDELMLSGRRMQRGRSYQTVHGNRLGARPKSNSFSKHRSNIEVDETEEIPSADFLKQNKRRHRQRVSVKSSTNSSEEPLGVIELHVTSGKQLRPNGVQVVVSGQTKPFTSIPSLPVLPPLVTSKEDQLIEPIE